MALDESETSWADLPLDRPTRLVLPPTGSTGGGLHTGSRTPRCASMPPVRWSASTCRATLLAGLLLNRLFGWADPVAALAMIWWIRGEAREAVEAARTGRHEEDDD